MNQQLTDEAEQAVRDLSRRYGVSSDAVRALLHAVSAGGGRMAQFCHAELGGNGQWMLGGMTMVGDMFNHQLKAQVSGLCQELSNLLASQPVFAPAAPTSHSSASSAAGGAQAHAGGHSSGGWWPQELGQPSSTGSANENRYAVFPRSRRLALKQGSQLRIYDTLDHQITGVQQHSGTGSGSLTLTSQRGYVDLGTLPRVYPPPETQKQPVPEPVPTESVPPAEKAGASGQASSGMTTDQIFKAIEQLGQLHQQGVLNQEEFDNKKAELLARL